MSTGEAWELLVETVRQARRDHTSRVAAALAFFTVLSLPSLLVIVIAIAAAAFGRPAAESQILKQLRDTVGQRAADIVQSVMDNAAVPSSDPLTMILGGALLLFGATGAFAQMQAALNTIWEDKTQAGAVRGTITRRLVSFVMVLALAVLLLVSLTITAVLTATADLIGDRLPARTSVLRMADVVVSFALVTAAFAAIYRIVPDGDVAWGDVWIGAIGATLLFIAGKFVIATYLAHSTFSSTYGAASSVVILLLWIYLGALVFIVGAEFTQVYSRRHGSRHSDDGQSLWATGDR